MSPLLWLNGIVSVPCLLASAVAKPPMSFAFFALAVIIVFFSLWQYLTLVKRDPRLVQSEKLQFEMAKLDMVAAKGGSVVIDPVTIEFTNEPNYLPSATSTEDAEQ